jgi:glycosyltransferase involved in cell wall biosynthesis
MVVLTRHLAKAPGSRVSRRFLLGRCDALIAVSHFVAKVLREGVYEPDSPELERRARPPLLGDHAKIQVILGGIDTGRFKPQDGLAQRRAWGLEPRHYAFAVVGGYSAPRGKGQPEFLAAAARMHANRSDARFLIVGRGNMADRLQADIERLGLKGKAWLTPYCTDMPAAMNALDCLVHPAVGTEAMPGVVCEAQACGRPVIASNLDGVPEALAIGGIGQLVKPDSPEALAEAMVQMAGRPALRTEERQQAHRRVEELFSLQVSAQRHLEFYEALLGK